MYILQPLYILIEVMIEVLWPRDQGLEIRVTIYAFCLRHLFLLAYDTCPSSVTLSHRDTPKHLPQSPSVITEAPLNTFLCHPQSLRHPLTPSSVTLSHRGTPKHLCQSPSVTEAPLNTFICHPQSPRHP